MILIIININPIKRTAPIITGKSKVSRASTMMTPIHFQSKTYSTKTAPASNEANQPEKAVTTGVIAFLNA